MKRVLCTILIMAVLAFCACGSDAEPSASSGEPALTTSDQTAAPSETPTAAPTESEDKQTTYPLVVTDLSGAEIEIKSAGRIVSLAPSNTEIVVEEGGEDRLVAADASSAAIAPDVQNAGEYGAPDAESIIALSPDVVLAGSSLSQDVANQLTAADIPVVIAEATNFDQIEESFRLIGRIINEPAAAEELCAQLSSAVEDVQAAAPSEAMSVYFVLSFGDDGNWTSGGGSYVNRMIEYAGGLPVTAETSEPWLEYSLDDLAAADPDCIIVCSDAGDYSALAQTPGYMDLRACQNGLVFLADADVVMRPGPSAAEGLLALSGIMQAAAQGPAPTDGLEDVVAE